MLKEFLRDKMADGRDFTVAQHQDNDIYSVTIYDDYGDVESGCNCLTLNECWKYLKERDNL